MPSWEVVVQIKKDGVDLAGFPYRRTIETAEGADFNLVKVGGDGPLVFSPLSNINSPLQLIVVSSDQAIALQTAGFTAADGIISLLAGGLVIIVNVNQAPAGASPPLLICNSGADPANLKGAWGGP